MSRGPGYIQRRLMGALERRAYAARVGDLCCRFYHLSAWESPSDTQRQTVIKAVKRLAALGYPIGSIKSEVRGSELVVYRINSKPSREQAEELAKAPTAGGLN
jgi:hypothetical protein